MHVLAFDNLKTRSEASSVKARPSFSNSKVSSMHSQLQRLIDEKPEHVPFMDQLLSNLLR